MRVLALVPGAFGGHGGIAKFNRDLLSAMCTYPTCSEVVAIPRRMLMPDAAEPLPARLTYVTSGLGGKLRYLVTVSKVDHYCLSDAFVMPGLGEGFGIVYLEAKACGVPVVASKVDASPEAVRNGVLGILVDPSDQEDIKASVLEALKVHDQATSWAMDREVL